MRNKYLVSPPERLLKILDKELARMSEKYVREIRSKDIDAVKNQLESEGIDFSVPEHISKLTMSDFSDDFPTRDIDDNDEIFEEYNILSANIDDVRSYLKKGGAYYDGDLAKIKYKHSQGSFSGDIALTNSPARNRRPILMRRARVFVKSSMSRKSLLICAISGLGCVLVVCASIVTLAKIRNHNGFESLMSVMQGNRTPVVTVRINEMAERISSLEDAQTRLREIIVELSRNEPGKSSTQEDTYILPVIFDTKLFDARLVFKKRIPISVLESNINFLWEKCKSHNVPSIECGDVPASRQLISYSDKSKNE